MGVITETLEKLIGEYVRDRGLVLWFDPERHYEAVLPQLRARQGRILVLDGGFYKLRLEAEPFLRDLDPPKLVAYLPVSWEEAQEPLAEMLALGVDLRPGVSGNRNTRLAVIARRALKGRVADARLEDLDRQIELGSLTLAELEELVLEGGSNFLPTALSVHFGTALIDEAALDFLARPERDAELAARNGLIDWAKVLGTHYGLTFGPAESATTLRSALARRALTCELLAALGGDLPEVLRNAIPAANPVEAGRAAGLVQEWRNRRDIASTYPAAASVVEKALHLSSIDFADSALERVETFPSLERRLLRRVAVRIESDLSAAQIAEKRQKGFWAERDAELQAEWTLVWQAGRLMERAREIEKSLTAPCVSAREVIDQYTGAANWAELDTLHRRLERRAASLEFALANPAAELEHLVHTARRRHQQVSGAVAERFLRAWRAEGFAVTGYMRQTEIFDRFVAPEIASGNKDHRRVAYMLVDALRWELAQELPEVLGTDFTTRIELAIGTAPSITEIGMAALLPSAASGLRIGGTAKLQVSLHGRALKNRQDRISYLKERAGVSVVDVRLEDPRSFRRKLKDMGAGPALIFVTSREIDQSGEDEMTVAREHMERVLTHLGLAIRKLAEEGVDQFVIAADHGYLYGEDLAESEKIDTPGGRTVLIHRRVWAGQGAAASESYLLTDVSRFGAASDLEMAVPWNLAGFRTAGPTAYFHGGLSPQEILLPVVIVTPKMVGGSKASRKLSWDLALGSAKVTTRFLSVRVQAHSEGLFAEAWPLVRVEVRAAGDVCAIPVSGSYGFQETTGAVALRATEMDSATTEANTVTLMLTDKTPKRGFVSIHVVDAATGVELKKIENVEVSIAI